MLFEEMSRIQQNNWLRWHLSHWNEYCGLAVSFDKKTEALEKATNNQDLLCLIMHGYVPDLELDWVKFLVNFQIFGGVGTWEDICSFSGQDPRMIVNKYGWINFYLEHNLLKVFKRTKNGRVFELGDSAQTIIDYAVSN